MSFFDSQPFAAADEIIVVDNDPSSGLTKL